jgi:competence protein ComEA
MSDDDLLSPGAVDDEPQVGWRAWRDELRERWTGLQLAGGALLCVGALVAGVALVRPGAGRAPTEESLPMASAMSSGRNGAAASTTVPAVLVAHAAGAVVAPGLYRLPPGSRVADLVAAAGGFSADADADRVNLAALVHDGERVAVPRVGEPVEAGAGSESPSSDGRPAEPVDLNAATAAELDALPGIGPTTAQAIVDERSRHGPFRSVDDLLRVRGIGPAKLDQLRGLVTV